jgi:hypothetical protein
MSVPTTNTTCDIYRNAHSPPSQPDVQGVPCFLKPKGASTLTGLNYTHEMLVNPSVDIRDGYAAGGGATSPAQITLAGTYDKVYVPNMNGVPYFVVLVRRVGRGTPLDHLSVLLVRSTATYPTNNL